VPFTSSAKTLTSFDIKALSVTGFRAANVVSPLQAPSDFTGDGHSDCILWQSTSGQAAIWEMNGNNVTSIAAVGPNPGPSWKAA